MNVVGPGTADGGVEPAGDDWNGGERHASHWPRIGCELVGASAGSQTEWRLFAGLGSSVRLRWKGLLVTLEVRCMECDVIYRVPETAAGKKVRCRKCNELIAVPDGQPDRQTATKTSRSDAKRSDQARRHAALFDDESDDDVCETPVPNMRKPTLPARVRALPPKDAPSAPREEKPKRDRVRSRRKSPQVGGSTKDKLVFAGGVMAVFFALAMFFPAALYLVGIGFYWLSYLWVVGDAFEDEAGGVLATNNLFVMFRLLTRPLHLWPAWVFGGLGIVCMLAASGRLQWLRGG